MNWGQTRHPVKKDIGPEERGRPASPMINAATTCPSGSTILSLVSRDFLPPDALFLNDHPPPPLKSSPASPFPPIPPDRSPPSTQQIPPRPTSPAPGSHQCPIPNCSPPSSNPLTCPPETAST